ncbi:MAG TPA: membrane protein insertion efficiency factor YidD [Chloroflexi bacterium]|nr:membrane protein insertion efficiency factor YidD [Chloroflexota bacterium]
MSHTHTHPHDHEAFDFSLRPPNPDPSPLGALPRTPNYWPRLALLLLVRLYQMTLAKTLPPNTCRFYPTCSHYGYEAIYKYGVIKGGLMAIWRVLRCNPFNPGGYDPVP